MPAKLDKSVMNLFFNPRSVAIIGASIKKGTVGRALMENIKARFKGRIYPINIKYDEVLGLKCYKSVSDLPEVPDLVVIAVPARVVPKVMEECGRKGVKAAIVISAGFKEVGKEGAKLEEELLKVARRWDIRFIGPNCLGIYNAWSGLDTIFNPNDRQDKPGPGNVALISQSGALGAAILDWLAEAGVGMSKFISYGNAADVQEWELIEYLAEDPKTEVIMAYIEGVADGRRFLESLRKATSNGKPVIVLKAGKSKKGMKAVASHTGSLAGQYAVYEAAIRQFGGLLVNELNEMVVAAKTLSWLPTPKGDRVAIVTNGGGAGVLATDAIELLGLQVADLSESIRRELREKLPPAAAINNPVDVLGDAPPERYDIALDAVMRDEGVDAVLLISIMQSPAYDPSGVLKAAKKAVDKYRKPVVMAAPGGKYTVDKLLMFERDARIPSFRTPEEAAKALTYLVRWFRIRSRMRGGC